jgi:cytochrome c-type biogenesis protein CcmH
VKSRTVLGDRDQALAALATARKQFAADPRAAARLEALALGLGLEGRGA